MSNNVTIDLPNKSFIESKVKNIIHRNPEFLTLGFLAVLSFLCREYPLKIRRLK